MTTALGVAGTPILLAVIAYGVVKWIRGRAAALRDQEVSQANEAAEAERVRKMEAAEAAARTARKDKFDAKAATARTADDAARLLRDVSDDPTYN